MITNAPWFVRNSNIYKDFKIPILQDYTKFLAEASSNTSKSQQATTPQDPQMSSFKVKQLYMKQDVPHISFLKTEDNRRW
jgi:hypothetical protein